MDRKALERSPRPTLLLGLHRGQLKPGGGAGFPLTRIQRKPQAKPQLVLGAGAGLGSLSLPIDVLGKVERKQGGWVRLFFGGEGPSGVGRGLQTYHCVCSGQVLMVMSTFYATGCAYCAKRRL